MSEFDGLSSTGAADPSYYRRFDQACFIERSSNEADELDPLLWALLHRWLSICCCLHPKL